MSTLEKMCRLVVKLRGNVYCGKRCVGLLWNFAVMFTVEKMCRLLVKLRGNVYCGKRCVGWLWNFAVMFTVEKMCRFVVNFVVGWGGWWKSFIKIQRRLKYILWKRHGPSLALIKSFQESDRAKTVPFDIMAHITHAYFGPSRLTRANDGGRVRVQIVETYSFKKLKSDVQTV